MSKNEKLLIIVESPSKTKTISKYVDNASVIASVGHFKDLPKKDMGIDIDNDFAMQIESTVSYTHLTLPTTIEV